MLTIVLLFSIGEGALLAGPLLAALAAAGLPRSDRLPAIAAGACAAGLLLIAPNGGADSPVNIIAAICAAGFALGAAITALLATSRNWWASRRPKT